MDGTSALQLRRLSVTPKKPFELYDGKECVSFGKENKYTIRVPKKNDVVKPWTECKNEKVWRFCKKDKNGYKKTGLKKWNKRPANAVDVKLEACKSPPKPR